MALGRPSKYDPKVCDRVIELGRQGFSRAEMAADLDVSRQCLWNWSKEYSEFFDALTRAEDLSLAAWEAKPRQQILEGVGKHVDPA